MNRKLLSNDDLNYLSSLLATSLPLGNCLELLKTKRNEKLVDKIRNELHSGQLAEEIFKSYLPKGIKSYLLPLLRRMSFKDSLALGLMFEKRHLTLKKSFVSKVSYPCLLLVFAIVGLLAFDVFGLDSIISVLEMFNSDLGIYATFRIVYRIAVVMLFSLLVAIFLLVFYFSHKKRQVLAYLFISKHFPDSLIHILFCQEFISLFLICTRKGYKTKDTLELLKGLDNMPIIAFLAFHMDESLMAGNSLKDASIQPYFDTSLARFVKIGAYSLDYEEMLASYVELANKRIDKAVATTSLIVQIMVYAFIGILIAVVYQILFLPMKALTTF